MPNSKRGISFSGGGIRSAAISSGVIDEIKDKLSEYNYISMVSGGAYLYTQMFYNGRGIFPNKISEENLNNAIKDRKNIKKNSALEIITNVIQNISILIFYLFFLSIISSISVDLLINYNTIKISAVILGIIAPIILSTFLSNEKIKAIKENTLISLVATTLGLLSILCYMLTTFLQYFLGDRLTACVLGITAFISWIWGYYSNRTLILFITSTLCLFHAYYPNHFITNNIIYIPAMYFISIFFMTYYLSRPANNESIITGYIESIYSLTSENYFVKTNTTMPIPLICMTTSIKGNPCLVYTTNCEIKFHSDNSSINPGPIKMDDLQDKLTRYTQRKKWQDPYWLMALSGAALDSSTIPCGLSRLKRNSLFSMATYMENPFKDQRENHKWSTPTRSSALFDNLFDRTTEINKTNNLRITDGAFYDITGVIALILEEVQIIFCIDASIQQKKSTSLDFLVEKIKKNFKSTITISLTKGISIITFELKGKCFTIYYTTSNSIVDSNEELKNHKSKFKKYPNHPTLNQDFDKSLFDAYAEIGKHAILMFNEVENQVS